MGEWLRLTTALTPCSPVWLTKRTIGPPGASDNVTKHVTAKALRQCLSGIGIESEGFSSGQTLFPKLLRHNASLVNFVKCLSKTWRTRGEQLSWVLVLKGVETPRNVPVQVPVQCILYTGYADICLPASGCTFKKKLFGVQLIKGNKLMHERR